MLVGVSGGATGASGTRSVPAWMSRDSAENGPVIVARPDRGVRDGVRDGIRPKEMLQYNV